MCGIGGKVSFISKPDAEVGRLMCEQMDHRGPDSSGIYANGPVMLAHRRLSIIDLSESGNQPMSNQDGTVHIVFNGEIYNYAELHDLVEQYPFQSETDTEVLLHLYQEFGTDCLRHLRGMFAFAIWDENKEQLFVARDRLGQKPLYYHKEDGEFWFGSTIRAILSDQQVTASPDVSSIQNYLTYQYVPHPSTGFRGIKRLDPASYMVITEDDIKKRNYWSVSYRDKADNSVSNLKSRLRSKLYESTKLRMRSDVPVGVFLSGGVDSSIITAIMSDISNTPIRTYSIGFKQESHNETQFAREVAEMYDTNHHEYTVTPDVVEDIPKLVSEYEMPFGDPSALPTYHVSRVASDDTKVVLSGDAGDENFAGYNRYTRDLITNILSKVPKAVRRLGIKSLESFPESLQERTPIKYPQEALKIANGDEVQRYAEFICPGIRENSFEMCFSSNPSDELNYLRQAFAAADGPNRLDKLMHVDLVTYLPDDLLVKVDRASMAHSLEVRSPFLDHKLVEFSATIPSKLKWRRGNKKWLLKQAFKKDLPQSVFARKKQGFGVPTNEWFRSELREYGRKKINRLRSRSDFDSSGLDRLFREHQEGENYGHSIWCLVMLEEWYEQFMDENN